MSRSSRLRPIKRLLTELPRGSPFDMETLRAHGIEAKAASSYAREGWLVRLGHGAYALPGDDISAHAAARLLQQRVSGLHVGGKSALALQGVRQNLAPRETLVLWADERFAIPAWFSAHFEARGIFAHLFDWPRQELARETLTTPPGVLDQLLVSAPERAALEMLYEVGTHESLEESRGIFEGLRNLRPQVTGTLLSCCTSIKAVRLFLNWSRETGLIDVDALRQRFVFRVGSGSRWVSRLPDGTLLSLKPHG